MSHQQPHDTPSMQRMHHGDEIRQWLPRKQQVLLDKYLQELRLGRMAVTGTQQQSTGGYRLRMAHKTVNLLRHLIGSSTVWKTPAELLALLRQLGREVQAAAGPNDPSIANVVRRIMAAVREEAAREAQEEAAAANATSTTVTTTSTTPGDTGRLSLQTMLWALPQHVRSTSTTSKSNVRLAGMSSATRSDVQRQESLASEAELHERHQEFPESYYAARPNLKQAVLEAIQEIITDLEDLHRNINEQVVHHIHAGEIILTCGDSQTVESFLKAAAAKNTFQVIVCGSNNINNNSTSMAARLAAAGIDTTVTEVAAVFAIMPRVHKVVLPAHAVLANGGLVAAAGCNLAALAAHHLSVPVVAVTGAYKLCPMYPHEGQDTLQDLQSPNAMLGSSMDDANDEMDDHVERVHPRHDYIEPKHVNLYITNVGSFQPSFIYRLLAENYHSDDWESFE